MPLTARRKKRRPYAYMALAAIGVLGLLIQPALSVYGWFTGHEWEISHWPIIIFAALGFIGWYGITPSIAESGAGILTKSFTAILAVIRTGQRKDDLTAVVVTGEGEVATMPVGPAPGVAIPMAPVALPEIADDVKDAPSGAP